MNYLVYKISGGICHMLVQINFAIHLSKNSNRFLIIDCLGNAFDNDFNKYFNVPNFEYSTNYECLYSDNSVDINLYDQYIKGRALSVEDHYYLNDKLISIKAENVMRSDEKIIFGSEIGMGIFRDILWYIKVNKEIVDKISVNKIDNKYIGFHYRNTDMKHILESFIPKIHSLSEETNLIYLSTDDYTAFDRLKNLLNNDLTIIQYTKPYNNNGYSIHYGNPNKNEVTINGLIDMYHLIRSTYFIPSPKSGFSKKVIEFRKNDLFFK